MACFDVYRNPFTGAETTPWLLDVQAGLLDGLQTRIVIPLRRRDRFPGVGLPADLMPLVEIEGVACVVETPKLAAVPVRALKASVCSLADRRAEITRALDFVFQGY